MRRYMQRKYKAHLTCIKILLLVCYRPMAITYTQRKCTSLNL